MTAVGPMPRRPRLLAVNYEYPPVGGGGGMVTRELARQMVRLGVDVRVVTAACRDLPRFEVQQGVEIQRLAAGRRHFDHCSVREMVFFIVAALRALPGIARSWRPNAAIAFFTIPSGPPVWMLNRLQKIPYAVSLLGGDVPGFEPQRLSRFHKLTGRAIRRIWEDARGVAGISDGLVALAEAHMPGLEVDCIPGGVDVDWIVPSDAHHQGRLRLLFVGRHATQKSLDVLLDAFAAMPRRDGVTLRLVGDGPTKAALREQAQRLGIDGSVEFCGWAKREEIPSILSEADAFVLASNDEGMPIVMLEACAAGLPVVATALPGIQQVIAHGETGLLVPVGDRSALAAALQRIVDEPERRRAMGAAARRLVETRFTWRSAAESYLRLAGLSPAADPPDGQPLAARQTA